jgi:hypothetical protein
LLSGDAEGAGLDEGAFVFDDEVSGPVFRPLHPLKKQSSKTSRINSANIFNLQFIG